MRFLIWFYRIKGLVNYSILGFPTETSFPHACSRDMYSWAYGRKYACARIALQTRGDLTARRTVPVVNRIQRSLPWQLRDQGFNGTLVSASRHGRYAPGFLNYFAGQELIFIPYNPEVGYDIRVVYVNCINPVLLVCYAISTNSTRVAAVDFCHFSRGNISS